MTIDVKCVHEKNLADYNYTLATGTWKSISYLLVITCDLIHLIWKYGYSYSMDPAPGL